MSFGDKVRARRKEIGLTQEKLAEMAQCSVKTISKIENNNVVKSDKLENVAENLGLELQPKGGSL